MPVAMHPIAHGNHASDHRLTVLAIAGPIARAKNAIGNLLQARSRIVNISGPETQETARELWMGSTVRLTAQAADRGQAVVEPVVAGEIEMKDARFAA